MVDQAPYVSILTDPDKLLVAIPIFVMLAVGTILLASILRSPVKKKNKKQKEQDKIVQPDRINFREDFNNIIRTKDIEVGIRSLSLLANKFLSQLFQLSHSFTYDEIRKEAQAYGFREIVQLCDTLQKLNFARDNHSPADFRELSQYFEKAVDSYEYVIDEGRKKRLDKGIPLKLRLLVRMKSLLTHISKIPFPPLNLPPQKITFRKVWTKLTPAIKEMQIKQLEKNLLLKHRDLFSAETERQTSASRAKDGKAEILRLLKLGRKEIERGNTVSSSAAYNRLVPLFNSLAPKEREPFANQTSELYFNIINHAAPKATEELIRNINGALTSHNYAEARQLYHELRYIYDRLPLEPGKLVYEQWQQTIRSARTQ